VIRLPLLLSLILSGCAGAANVHGGTAVGNPPDALVRTRPGAAIALTEATLEVGHLLQAPCDLALPVTDDALGDVDLLTGDAIDLAGDAPCGLAIEADRVLLVGVADGMYEVSIEVEKVGIRLGRGAGWTASDLESDGHYVLELGAPSWLDDLRIDLAEDELIIGPEDDRADAVIERLEAATGLYPDPDADGIVTDADRAAAAMASWVEPEREPDDD
jgi:hypothetical protein